MCLYSKLIRNPKYKPNKKNGGIMPPVNDTRILWVAIGCKQCIECRKQKAREWQIRLMEDIKQHKNGKFITLTFSNESIKKIEHEINYNIKAPYKPLEGYELDNRIATYATRHFLERWRKTYKKSVRHWLVTELGHKGTENIHLHGIIWTDQKVQEIENHWQYGYTWKGYMKNGKLLNYVNNQTVNYIVKYVNKVDHKHKYYKSIILTSAGIGRRYINGQEKKENKFNESKTIETYRTATGHKIAMPIYWRNAIWNDAEREALWLHKLDKLERWVCGERVDISRNEKEYHKLIRWYRQKNKELGYGNGDKNYNTIEYENNKRKILTETRIKNAKYKTPSARSNQKG